MVITYVKTKQSGDMWVRESFVDPRHYAKWKAMMGKDLVAIKPVRKGVRTYA